VKKSPERAIIFYRRGGALFLGREQAEAKNNRITKGENR
jgi:hypothetical protein